jgi:hypothetical protein
MQTVLQRPILARWERCLQLGYQLAPVSTRNVVQRSLEHREVADSGGLEEVRRLDTPRESKSPLRACTWLAFYQMTNAPQKSGLADVIATGKQSDVRIEIDDLLGLVALEASER